MVRIENNNYLSYHGVIDRAHTRSILHQ